MTFVEKFHSKIETFHSKLKIIHRELKKFHSTHLFSYTVYGILCFCILRTTCALDFVHAFDRDTLVLDNISNYGNWPWIDCNTRSSFKKDSRTTLRHQHVFEIIKDLRWRKKWIVTIICDRPERQKWPFSLKFLDIQFWTRTTPKRRGYCYIFERTIDNMHSIGQI